MLFQKDMERLSNLNRKNGWGFSKQQLLTMTTRHKRARQTGDIRTIEEIEYRLEDANFHTECNLLRCGQYEELRKIVRARG